jgi:hypothetical protein
MDQPEVILTVLKENFLLKFLPKLGDDETAVENQLFKIVAKQFFNTLNI